MARRTIRIAVRVDHDAGGFCVHPNPFKDDCESKRDWRVTHATSGYAAGDFRTRYDAIQWADYLSADRRAKKLRTPAQWQKAIKANPSWRDVLKKKLADCEGVCS
jgi:hypothetical protein